MEQEKKQDKKMDAISVACILPLILVLIMEMFFKLSISTSQLCYSSMMLAILISYAVFVFILSITKKVSIAATIFSVIIFLLMIINQLKISYTGEPIYFSDINFLGNSNDFFSIVFSGNIYSVLKYSFSFFVLFLIFALIVIYIKQYELEITKLKVRISMFLGSLFILLLLFIPSNFTKNIYLNVFFQISQIKDYAHYTTNYSYYAKYGLLPGMYGVMLNNRFSEPDGYNSENLDTILAENSNNEKNSSWGKPNIILMFSESFWDVGKIEEVTFDKEVASNFNELKKVGKKIDILTCTYGGMSENVAFEILTGGKMHYFPRGYCPVMSLYKQKNSQNLLSIVKELGNNGYTSKIVFGKDYYNSENSFKNMGFDEYLELTQTEENTKGNYISDEYMADLIIDALKNKEEDEPIFYMSESIQSHMPYSKNRYDEYDISIQNSTLSEKMNDTLLSYSQGIYDADQNLRKVYDYIQTYDEPTILIFLGDHLPYLYTEKGKNLIDNLQYFNTEDELENTYRKYNTEALILSNYEISDEEIPQYLSNEFLLTYIINNMDVEIDNYYKWLFTTMETLPASNLYVSLDKDGKIYSTSELEDKMKETNDLKELMQYKFFIEPTR